MKNLALVFILLFCNNLIFSQLPTIQSFTPTSGSAGSIIKISGTHFNGSTDVTFGRTPVSSFTISNDSTISAVVGIGSTGYIVVVNPAGSAIDSTPYFTFIQLKPNIVSFSPQTGTYNTSVTINGTHFSGTTSVSFGGTPLWFSVSNDSTIIAVVGTGSTGNIKVTNSAGSDSSNSIFTYNQTVVKPTIQSFTPKSGSTGSNIIISGTHFSGTTSVSFGGTPASSFTVSNDSTINAVVGLGTSGYIGVANPAGSAGDSTTLFTFIQSKPNIVSFSPQSGTYNTSVLITGTHFSGTTSVSFGGISPLSFTVSNDSTISAIIGTGSTGNIKVTNSAGSDSSISIFTYTQTVVKPTIQSFTPTSGSTGSIIKISGTHFTGTSSVSFGGTRVSSFTVSNDSTISAVIGIGSTGAIIVVNPAGSTIDSTTLFTFILSQPKIVSFSPQSGTYNTSVTITGTNFSGTTTVSFGGTQATTFTVSNDSTISAVVGPGSTGNIKVTNSAGSDSSISIFTYNQTVVKPTIQSFTPTSGSTGSIIKISGTHFNGSTSVSFGGTIASSFTVSNDSTISAGVGIGSTGSIVVVNPAGNAIDSTTLFTFIQSKPNILSFSPQSGTFNSIVTINGTHFSGTTSVSFGGISPLRFTVSNDSTISAIVGTGSTGNIKVTNSAGSDSSISIFTYNQTVVKPTVQSFTPTSGSPGSIIKISGTHFNGSTSVSFGGTIASSFTVSNDSTISAVVGIGSTGAIVVVNPAGNAIDSTTIFTFIQSKPNILSFSPQSGSTGSIIKISGTHFSGTTSVSFGGITATSYSVVADSIINAIVGGGATGNIKVTTATNNDTSKTQFIFVSAQTIINSSLNTFISCIGLSSNAQNLSITTSNFTSDLIIKAPNNIEIAFVNDTIYKSSLTQSVPTNGSLNDTFLLRVSKNAFIGNYSDTVKFYSGNMLIKYIIIAYNVLKLPTQPSIIQSADNLISSQSVFYKWHLNNIILQDSTPVIKISSIGIYRVETSDDNFCWNFSNDYIIQTSPSSLEQNDYDLNIYPNPTPGQFYIQLKLDKKYSGYVQIAILDITGTIKWKFSKFIFNDNSIKIPINLNLNKGIFSLQIIIPGYKNKAIQIIGL